MSAAALNKCCAIWFRAEPSGVAPTLSSSSNGGTQSGLRISFSGIEKRYGMRMALRGVSLEIGAGECVALVGHNGSGKTTLLKITALLARPSKGQISFSSGAAPLSTSEVKHRIGMVAHNTLVYDELTAEENLVFFAKLFDLPDPVARARRSLEPVGLARRADDMVRTFSRGMRQRLAIARALLASPQLLLFDEPAAGCTIVMSTHGRNETQGSVTRAIRLEGGEVTHDSGANGDPYGVLAMAAVRETAEGDAR